jgi:hypothetical protein
MRDCILAIPLVTHKTVTSYYYFNSLEGSLLRTYT